MNELAGLYLLERGAPLGECDVCGHAAFYELRRGSLASYDVLAKRCDLHVSDLPMQPAPRGTMGVCRFWDCDEQPEANGWCRRHGGRP